MMNKTENIVQTGDLVTPTETSEDKTDQLLSEIAQLYRDRFLALQENDTILIQLLTHQIADLKTRLEHL